MFGFEPKMEIGGVSGAVLGVVSSESEERQNYDVISVKNEVTAETTTAKARQLLSESEPSDSECPNLDSSMSESRKWKRRKKTTSRPNMPVSHVEAERQRREKLNRRFYALRSVVPKVSKMDKASLLADAVDYIKELRSKIEMLESKLKSEDSEITPKTVQPYLHHRDTQSTMAIVDCQSMGEVAMEVKFTGSEGLIQVQGPDVNYPAARLMDAMRDLGVMVHHAHMSKVKELMLQDVVVKIPNGVTSEGALRAAIFRRFQS